MWRVVVRDDQTHPAFAQYICFLKGGDAAINRYEHFNTVISQSLDGAAVQAVSFFYAVRHIKTRLPAGASNRMP